MKFINAMIQKSQEKENKGNIYRDAQWSSDDFNVSVEDDDLKFYSSHRSLKGLVFIQNRTLCERLMESCSNKCSCIPCFFLFVWILGWYIFFISLFIQRVFFK
ncbi:MAG: hypothetical protein C5B43_00520 [Verrucomicrobia bacterium]|nr:MAG: hypothetical protein C5B43_00520 [Verrucomicrobiota bacterium]